MYICSNVTCTPHLPKPNKNETVIMNPYQLSHTIHVTKHDNTSTNNTTHYRCISKYNAIMKNCSFIYISYIFYPIVFMIPYDNNLGIPMVLWNCVYCDSNIMNNKYLHIITTIYLWLPVYLQEVNSIVMYFYNTVHYMMWTIRDCPWLWTLWALQYYTPRLYIAVILSV